MKIAAFFLACGVISAQAPTVIQAPDVVSTSRAVINQNFANLYNGTAHVIAPQGTLGNNTGDDSIAINTALSLAAPGNLVFLPAGTYRLAAATLTVADGVCLVGAGPNATLLNQAGAFAAVTFLNSQNSCMVGIGLSTANEGVLVKSSNPSHGSAHVTLSDVDVNSIGNGFAGVHINNSGGSPVSFPTFSNVNVNGGSPGSNGTRVGFLLDGSNAGFNVEPKIYGGRAYNLKYGVEAANAEHLIVTDTEFDAIQSSGSGIAVWLQSGVNNSQINPRLEGEGVGGSNDKDWQFDSGSFSNWMTAVGYSGAGVQGTDAGTANCIFGSLGSGGLVNSCLNPQTVGNVTVFSGKTFLLPGATSGQFVSGGSAATSAQVSGLSTPNTLVAQSTGYSVALISDSLGRNLIASSSDFNGTSLGTNFILNTPTGANGVPTMTFTSNGGTTPSPRVSLNTLIQVPLTTPGSSSAACSTGTVAWDAGFIYVCTSTNTWKRSTLSSF